MLLMPSEEQEQVARRGSNAWTGGNSPQHQQQLAPPLAADLAQYGAACRAAGYQPQQLLLRLRAWLLLQLAKHGPKALRKLAAGPRRGHALAPAGGIVGASAPAQPPAPAAPGPADGESRLDAPSSSSDGQPRQQQQQQQRQQQQQWLQDTRHASALVHTLMLLRHTRYAEPLLLERLAHAVAQMPVRQQLTAQQLVMLLTSFKELGHFPACWAQHGLLRGVGQHVAADNARLAAAMAGSGGGGGSSSSSSSGTSAAPAGSLCVQDVVEVLDCLAAWRGHASIDNALLRQHVLPGLCQLLLGVPHTPKAAARSTTSATSMSSSSSSSSDEDAYGGGSADTAAGSPSQRSSSPASSSSSSSSMGLVSDLTGPQTVVVLRSLTQLEQLQGHRALQQALLQRLQDTWRDVTPSAQVAAAHAAARLHVDLSDQLDVPQLLLAEHAQRDSAGQSASSTSSSSSNNTQQQSVLGTASSAARLLWTFATFGKHPGARVLDAALAAILAQARAAAAGSKAAAGPGADSSGSSTHQLPLREVSSALYSAAVLQEQQHPAALGLLRLLTDAAASGELLSHPQFAQQSEQLAACMLAAQSTIVYQPQAPAGSSAADGEGAAQQGGSMTPAAAAGSAGWLALPGPVQQRLQEVWRRKCMRRAARQQTRPYLEQQQLVLCLRQLGLRCKANALSDDGVVCIDVAATTSRGALPWLLCCHAVLLGHCQRVPAARDPSPEHAWRHSTLRLPCLHPCSVCCTQASAWRWSCWGHTTQRPTRSARWRPRASSGACWLRAATAWCSSTPGSGGSWTAAAWP
jgi:hypothetical protein